MSRHDRQQANDIPIDGFDLDSASIQEFMKAFDGLPRALRDALNYSDFEWSPIWIKSDLRAGRDPVSLVRSIRAADREAARVLAEKENHR